MDLLIQEKVVGGKLLCVEAEARDGRIMFVRITGDFFLHPEETIDDIEGSLKGANPDDAEGIVAMSLARNGAQLIGASPGDIARLIRKAVS